LLTVFEAVDDRPSAIQVVDKYHQLPVVNNLTSFEQNFDSYFERRVEFSVFCSAVELTKMTFLDRAFDTFGLWLARPALFRHVIGLTESQPDVFRVFPGSKGRNCGLVTKGA
jgi:hypothetical protein